MRGWKVSLEPDLSRVGVGKSRGPAVALHPIAVGKSSSTPLRVLLVDDFPDSWSEDHEQALTHSLAEEHGGDWVLLHCETLHPRWPQLTDSERGRLLSREGFQSVAGDGRSEFDDD